MPTYDYACEGCGPFEAIRPIAQRDQAAQCPRCSQAARRVMGAGPRLAVMDDGTRRLIAAEESRAGSYRRMRHPAACGCCRT